MDGDFPDLARFVDIKEKHHAMLLRRRGPLARHDGPDRPRHRRARRHRPLRRRRLDGHAVQVARELRRLHRRLRRTRRVPQVHGARVRLQRRHLAAQRGHRAGRPDAPAARAAARRPAPRAVEPLPRARPRARPRHGPSPAGTPVVPVIVGNSVKLPAALPRAVRSRHQRPADHPSGRSRARRAAAVVHHDQPHRVADHRERRRRDREELAKL